MTSNQQLSATSVQEFELEIESDVEPTAFARILATVVNGSPVFLARVVVGGTVVYPTTYGSLFDPFTVRSCRFRVRDANAVLSPPDLDALLARIGSRYTWSRVEVRGSSPVLERRAS